MAHSSRFIVAEEKMATQTSVVLKSPTKLNELQKRLFCSVVEAPRFDPIFVSGSAGTGKSSLLMALRDYWQEKQKIVFVATFTNLAARNINGKTCHSLFGFDFYLNLVEGRKVGLPDYLIIDEISMIPSKMLDGIDTRLKQTSRAFHLPFGGVNVIAFGDLYQLQPVSGKDDTKLPPYEANVWEMFKLYELKDNMRQSEPEFIHNLNLLRIGDLSCLVYFNTFVVQKNNITINEELAHTSLVSTHREAEDINRQCYSCVCDTENEMELWCEKKTKKWAYTYNVYNAEQEMIIFKPSIKVCPGTRLMITHTTQGLCNGDMGIVEKVSERQLYIRREHDGALKAIEPITLCFNTSEKKYVRFVTGLPITYGWAITIHKAQGMTMKNLIVHPNCFFAPGQAYVALSRSVHSDGLKLMGQIPEKGVCDMSFIDVVYKKMFRLELNEKNNKL